MDVSLVTGAVVVVGRSMGTNEHREVLIAVFEEFAVFKTLIEWHHASMRNTIRSGQCQLSVLVELHVLAVLSCAAAFVFLLFVPQPQCPNG
ncbi:hypothetical protein PI125_g17943 [Phytophthora idaei]|nr:hypothetical protein PI125_g17943 [Phytophthora idaei]